MKAKTNKLLSVFLTAALLTTAGCAAGTKEASTGANPAGGASAKPEAKKVYKIGISQIVEHPSLDATRKGFLAALKDSGFVEKENLDVDVQIAQGDMTNNMSIAQKFAGDKKDLVLGIATPSAQSLVQVVKDAPVLFTAVTDPLGAKLVNSLDKPGGNVSGVMDTHPDEIPSLMDFIAKQFTKVKTVGIVANEGEQNALVAAKRAEDALAKHNIKLVRAAVTNSSEVKQATESLIGKVDAIYVAKDNTVVSSLESVVQVAEKNKLPLFVGDIDSVKRGGFATFGYEYYDIGYTTGKMAADVLKNGKKAGEIPVAFPEKLDLYLSLKAAKAQGIEVTQPMKDLAKDKKNILE